MVFARPRNTTPAQNKKWGYPLDSSERYILWSWSALSASNVVASDRTNLYGLLH
jgi:hypothetical protein